MRCPLCSTENIAAFKARIAAHDNISYFSCNTCGFVHTEEPYWLPEVYKDAYNDEDTGALQRNLYFADVVSSLIVSFFNPKARFLDFGGGHGIFVRLMRDKGFDFRWYDMHAKNIFCRGFEYSKESGPVELVTAMECFEHFARPLEEISEMFAAAPAVFFTTDLLPDPVPAPEKWYYYGLTHGQHISFYSPKTLSFLAEKFGCKVYSNGFNIHLFTKKEISPAKFIKAIRPDFFTRRKIRKLLKSKTQPDHDAIVEKKKRIPSK
jgi:hypothetical protein